MTDASKHYVSSGTETDMEQLVAIRTGLSLQQAHMLKSNLEGRGIPTFLSGDEPGVMRFGGQTSLLVRAKHWKHAEELLSNITLLPSAPNAHADDMACTQCGSARIHPFVGEVPTFFPKVNISAEPEDGWFHCLECDSYWRDRMRKFASFPIAFLWSITLGLVMLAVYSLIQWLKWL